MTVLLLEFTSTRCNSWPSLEILHNQRQIFSGTVKEKLRLEVALSPSAHNVIELTGIGKQQGTNNVWDTRVDDAGRIIERGTHDELTRPSGKYSDMVRRQTESHDQRGSCSTAR